MNLFVYGTLMYREQIEFLLRRKLGDPVEATIRGFTMIIASEWGYPVIIPESNSIVEGVVWRELTEKDFITLDYYEGCDEEFAVYQRERRKVVAGGYEEEAWVYVASPAFLESE